ncbi:MAG: hypothetical protein MZU95_13425 [Desulfomicrobium escambiense]|nr:hypothetical protein [Desulfomicrobium escambiense]
MHFSDRLLFLQKPFHPQEIVQFASALSAKWRGRAAGAGAERQPGEPGPPAHRRAAAQQRACCAARSSTAAHVQQRAAGEPRPV